MKKFICCKLSSEINYYFMTGFKYTSEEYLFWKYQELVAIPFVKLQAVRP